MKHVRILQYMAHRMLEPVHTQDTRFINTKEKSCEVDECTSLTERQTCLVGSKQATLHCCQTVWRLAGPPGNARTAISVLAIWTRVCVSSVNV